MQDSNKSMFNIRQLLDRFKGIGAEGYAARVAAATVIESLCRTAIPIENIIWNKATLVIKGNPALRSQIFIKKHQLLAEIRKRVPSITVVDIQ